MDWGLTPPDNVGTDPWLQAPYNGKPEDQSAALSPPQQKNELQFSRADSIAFADQYRSATYNILLASEIPLSTAQIHSILSSTNQALVLLLDQRKSTSCMAKLLAEDPQKRFQKFISVVNKKNSTYFGITGKEYAANEWAVKTETERPIDQNHKSDVEQTENLREYVKAILLQHGNKPMNSSQILAVIKEENFGLSQILVTKNRNYLVKTLRRDPKNRFAVTKGAAGVVNFSLNV